MELKLNLAQETRSESLARFSKPHFQKVARVCVGEPSKEYREKIQAMMLADKEAKGAVEKKKHDAELNRKKLLDEKRKKAEEAKKARELAEKKKRDEAAKKKKAEEGTAEENDGAAEEEVKDGAEVKEEEPAKEDEVPADEPIALTEEEKNTWHRKTALSDFTEDVLAKTFSKFSVPTKDEGFDRIEFEWRNEAKSRQIVRDYVLEQKKTQKVHDLQLTDWFKEEWAAWQKELQAWKGKQRVWKDPAKVKQRREKKEKEEKEKA